MDIKSSDTIAKVANVMGETSSVRFTPLIRNELFKKYEQFKEQCLR